MLLNNLMRGCASLRHAGAEWIRASCSSHLTAGSWSSAAADALQNPRQSAGQHLQPAWQQQQQQPCQQPPLLQHLPCWRWLGLSQLQVASMATLAPYEIAPRPLPRFRKPGKGGKLQRMVIRVPTDVELTLKDQQLLISGRTGTVQLDLTHLDPTGLVGWQVHFLQPATSSSSSSSTTSSSSMDSSSTTSSGSAASCVSGSGAVLLCVSPSKRYFRGIKTHIENAVTGVSQGYLVGVTVKGVGYRLEPVEAETVTAALSKRSGPAAVRRMYWEQEAEKGNPAYPYPKPTTAVRLKVGYTKAAIFPLPEGVLAFFVRPTLMYLYGVDKHLVTNTAAAIRAIRKPNAYTGNGIQLVGEEVKLKQRAGSK